MKRGRSLENLFHEYLDQSFCENRKDRGATGQDFAEREREREGQTVPQVLGLRDTLAFLVCKTQRLALLLHPFSLFRSPLLSRSLNYRLPFSIVWARLLLWVEGEGRKGYRAR